MSGAAEGTFGSLARQLSGLAMRLLGWRPAEFWSATPAELAAALNSADAAAGLDRAALAQLMERIDG